MDMVAELIVLVTYAVSVVLDAARAPSLGRCWLL